MSSATQSTRELKPEQATAAHTLDRHVSVTAGPGSGKTTVLVERYLHILRENKNLNIDQIVAITFTNRAANEMRERLRKDLDRILRECAGEERRRWMRYKRTLDGAVINTIHGFCARLLREFPGEARIDPQFLLLDAHDAAILLEAAVEETLTEFISKGRETISQLAVGFGRGKVAEALVQLYWNVRGQGLKLDELNRRTLASHATPDTHKQALADLDKVMNDFIGFGRLSLAAETRRAFARSNWPALRQLIAAERPSLADYCNAIEAFRASARLTKNSVVGSTIEKLDAQLWGEEKKGPLGLVPQICFDLHAKDYALEIIEVLKEVERRYREKKQGLAALDFDDLQLRALELLEQPAVLTRATERYRFFLVDEFQDTNSVQRELMHKLALSSAAPRANLFIVGDRKQSIYGFRGADVDVFQQTTETLQAAGGLEQPLHLNFRSQPALINFFNYLFGRLFQRDADVKEEELPDLGFVEFEQSKAQREQEDSSPLVELLIDTKSPAEDDPKAQRTQAERDAKQVAQRILSLTGNAGVSPTDGGTSAASEQREPGVPSFEFRDIALLFRAMTDVPTYESVLRSANIPFQTVQGKGFYEREEITDLIQLLRFLDNKTDELALAAVLRSPLGGISDNALLALRCAPWLNEVEKDDALHHFSRPRNLFYALRRHHEIAYIETEDHAQLDRVGDLLSKLIERRNHYAIADLLRFAVEECAYLTVIAANFDGAQRLANVQKLFDLAERFEHSGAHLIRDLVRYVEEFEAIGSREGEGQIDDSANAVRLMTIHQAKGLEFPVVIIPNLHHRSLKPQEHWYALDRHRGLTVKIPDGRGKQVSGFTLESFRERNRLREHFESIRLLYVAATRAKDKLILAGATDELAKLNGAADNWLKLIWQKLELQIYKSGTVDLGDKAQLAVTLNLADESLPQSSASSVQTAAHLTAVNEGQKTEVAASLSTAFPLLQPIVVEPGDLAGGLHRISVTQLINYRRCPRQYYFDRLLHVPSAEQLAVWNDAEAPEPPANLTATLKGAVIHRFCETYCEGDQIEERLRQSFEDVLGARRAQLADRMVDIDRDEALKELLPLAQNYLSSQVFQRIQTAQRVSGDLPRRLPRNEAGLWSELSFRLRLRSGILTGTIDKLFVSSSQNGKGFDIEIIDFKTNRFRAPASDVRSQTSALGARTSRPQSAEGAPNLKTQAAMRARRPRSRYSAAQFDLDFSGSVSEAKSELPDETKTATSDIELAEPGQQALDEQIRLAASDYQLQMQAYVLAVRELAPDLIGKDGKLRVTLHFLDPDREFQLSEELLAAEVCARAIDDAMTEILSSTEPGEFPVRPATHCRMCNFLGICPAGREWLRSARRDAVGPGKLLKIAEAGR